MADYRAGGLEYGGRTYRFDDARCRWSPGALDVEAKGSRCGLSFVGVPFPGAIELTDLPGRIWEPDEDELALHADTFVEGGLDVRGRPLSVLRSRIECRRYDAARRLLVVSFCLAVEDEEYGDEGEVDGVAYCCVISDDEVGV